MTYSLFKRCGIHLVLSPLDSVPPSARSIIELIEAAGLELWIRHVRNIYKIPYFSTLLLDPNDPDPVYANGGYGCHPSAEVSLLRAVTEAAQSRLSFIHGGRDDLMATVQFFGEMQPTMRSEYFATLRDRFASKNRVERFESIEVSDTPSSLHAALDNVLDRVRQAGFDRVLQYVYTNPEQPLQIVRVAVPGAENFTRLAPKIGIRLRDHLRARRVER